MSVVVPKTYKDRKQYLRTIKELIDTEAELERLQIETIAEKDVDYVFEERLKVYSRIRMQVSKANQEHLREHTSIAVVIPFAPDQSGISKGEYVGVGNIKKVILNPSDPKLTLIVQIDVVNPIEKFKR